MKFSKKIKLVREQMRFSGIDAYIVPSSDPHASEYLPEYYKTREWISGFKGSAGTLVITQKKCALWTDGRYFIQAEKELAETDIIIIKMGMPSEPTISQWLIAELDDDFSVGFNGLQMMTSEVQRLQKHLKHKNVKIDFTSNIIDKIWLDRPYLPSEKIYIHDDIYNGATSSEKIQRIKDKMNALGASSHLITKLDDIAWVLNLRGNDITNNPYFLSYLFISNEKVILYVDPLKLNKKIIEKLHSNHIKVKLYEDLLNDLGGLKCLKAIMLDKSATPYFIYNSLENRCKVIDHRNPSTDFKAVKNDVELKHLENCYIDDGVAVVKFLSWLSNVGMESLTEIDIDTKITAFRSENPLMRGKSFDTIAAYKDHGAIMHYKATADSAYTIEPKGLLLIDSGAQYLNGTTDITRTVAMGPLTEEERTDFTLTLKSMLALSRAVFLEGATGTHLDTISRMNMWEHAMDYKCGTGHGIGYFLGVHEGPGRISMNLSDVPLVPGMVFSNEPGVYRNGKHGVRLENIIYVVPHLENEFGRFLRFETLTMCPLDLDAIDLNMMTKVEKDQLNAYHEKVKNLLSPKLNAVEIKWLENATRAI